jgi:1-acyl-sn-glycerol-3-phosphate acyltransferase
MLYSFAKILMTAGLRLFYRHICTTGLENVPPKGPAIIIANHNASLMDAALLGILLKRKAWFFARGDVFRNRPIQKVLWWLHMMPVHGHQGGRKTLHANSNSFSSGQQILAAGGIVVFFPESTSHTEHQLLPFRKGVFRLAFDTAAAQQFAFDIPIVPVGITYDHPVKCRTTVQVHAGAPLSLLRYKEAYIGKPAAALLLICRDAREAIYQLVLHINEASRLPAASRYLVLDRTNARLLPEASWKLCTDEKLKREQAICTAINQAGETAFEQKNQSSLVYFEALAEYKATDRAVAGQLHFPVWKQLVVWLGFPLYLAGLLLNGLPVLIARVIADKKVYRLDFYSWIFVAVYSFLYFFWLLGLFLVFSAWGPVYALLLLMLTIAAGLFAYAYKDLLRDRREQKAWQSLQPAIVQRLKSLRAAVQ